jgi:hypothetical protein
VAFDAVGEVEAEEGEDDVVEVDAEAGADVAAGIIGGELVGEVVAVGGAAAVKAGVAGVVEGDGAEGEEAPLKEGDGVFGAGDGAAVAAELIDVVAAEVGGAAEGELLVGGHVAAGGELEAELELVLAEEAPAVVGAEGSVLVAVAVEAGDGGFEVELEVGTPGDAVEVVAVVDGDVGLEGDVPAVFFGAWEGLAAGVLRVAEIDVGAAEAQIADEPPEEVPADEGAGAEIGRGGGASDVEGPWVVGRIGVLVELAMIGVEIGAPGELGAANGGVEEGGKEEGGARADLAVEEILLVEAAKVVLRVADAEGGVAGKANTEGAMIQECLSVTVAMGSRRSPRRRTRPIRSTRRAPIERSRTTWSG